MHPGLFFLKVTLQTKELKYQTPFENVISLSHHIKHQSQGNQNQVISNHKVIQTGIRSNIAQIHTNIEIIK